MNENEETVQQEVQPQVEEQVEAVQNVEPVESPQEEQSAEQNFEHNKLEDNLRELRAAKRREKERAEQAEYERDQLVKYFENMQKQPQQQQQDDIGVSPDDYVEGKHLGKVTKTVKELKQEVQQWKAYSEEMTAELKLSSEFSDFNDVVTADNVKAFIKRHPEMRGAIQNSDPLYNRGKATYRLIKQFMGEEVAPVDRVKQAKIQNNASTPRPSASIKEKQTSPLSQANMFAEGYTEEIGAALEKEMYDAIRRYN